MTVRLRGCPLVVESRIRGAGNGTSRWVSARAPCGARPFGTPAVAHGPEGDDEQVGDERDAG